MSRQGLLRSELRARSRGIEVVSVAVRDGRRMAVIRPFRLGKANQGPSAEQRDRRAKGNFSGESFRPVHDPFPADRAVNFLPKFC